MTAPSSRSRVFGALLVAVLLSACMAAPPLASPTPEPSATVAGPTPEASPTITATVTPTLQVTTTAEPPPTSVRPTQPPGATRTVPKFTPTPHIDRPPLSLAGSTGVP